jgi:hypothetical protein
MGKLRVLILLAIIAGIGVGSGCMVFAVGVMMFGNDEMAAFLAVGSTLMTASVAAFIAYLARSFRDIDEDRR